MTLIDADMLKSAIARYSEKLLSHKNLSIVKNAIREVLGDINFAIDIQPTIDAVPVSTLEQIKWERDSFAEQIREIGGEPFAKWDAMDVVKVVRCKDCKHRPYEDANGNPVFPDDVCPCQCSEDPYYGWNPPSDWFCPKGEKVTE